MKNILDNKLYRLWRLISQTRTSMLKLRKKHLSATGISTTQMAILYVIQATDGKVLVADIARWLIREPHSIYELLIRMEKTGLVRKAKNLGKDKLGRIQLTDKGREVLEQAITIESMQLKKIFSSISNGEQKQLASLLKKLRDTARKELGMKPELPYPPY